MRQSNYLLIPSLSLCAFAVLGCGGVKQHRAFYDDQTLRQTGQLDGYKPVGTWTTYHADGSLASQRRVHCWATGRYMGVRTSRRRGRRQLVRGKLAFNMVGGNYAKKTGQFNNAV